MTFAVVQITNAISEVPLTTFLGCLSGCRPASRKKLVIHGDTVQIPKNN